MTGTDLPETILRGIEIVRRGDPWSIVQLRVASPQAGRVELLALLERAANSIRAVGVLNDAGRAALIQLIEAIEAASKLDDATAYPWAVVAGSPDEGGGTGRPRRADPAPAVPSAEGAPAAFASTFPEPIRRAIEAVRITDPNRAAAILRQPYQDQRRILAALFAEHSSMIQSASSWGGIGADGYAAIEALDAAVALLKHEIG